MSKWVEIESLIDAHDEYVCEHDYQPWVEFPMWSLELMQKAPSIDLVHCGECKRVNTKKCPFYSAGWGYTDKDFCSCGERSE